MVEKVFSVALDGRDDENCLHQQASCRTVGFVLENEWHSDVRVAIYLKQRGNNTYTEPCVDNMQNVTCQCFVNTSGENSTHRPEIRFLPSNPENDTAKMSATFFRNSFCASNQT